jgi:hypothetical protein
MHPRTRTTTLVCTSDQQSPHILRNTSRGIYRASRDGGIAQQPLTRVRPVSNIRLPPTRDWLKHRIVLLHVEQRGDVLGTGTVPACLKLSGCDREGGVHHRAVSHGSARTSTVAHISGRSHRISNIASRRPQWSGSV